MRVNGRVSRSAVNLFSGKNGENGAAVIAAEVSYRPDIVLVVLGTNDMGLNAQADAAAFARIRDAFTVGGAKVYAIGPPAFARGDHVRESVVVYDTLGRVFGAGNVIDWRALSGDQVSPPARSADLVHFTSAGAQVAGQRLAAAVLAHRVPIWGSASPKLRAWWPVPVTAAVAAAGLIGAAVYVRRRGVKLRGPEALPASERQHVHRVIEPEIDGAVERALAAGATAPLEYIGAGAEGIVFCDPTQTAYKVGREGRRGLATEAAFFKKASQVPAIKRHIAKFKRYDSVNDVIVRECVRQRGERHGRPRRLDDAEAHDMTARIREAMEPYGFTAPERKGDSYVFVSGRGPVLVDGGFVHKRGNELVKDVLDFVNERVLEERGAFKRSRKEVAGMYISDVEWERGKTIPAPIADRLLVRLRTVVNE